MSERTVSRIIVLEVRQDHNHGEPAPPWWEALELPAPERWPELTAEHAAFAREKRRLTERMYALDPAANPHTLSPSSHSRASQS